ncbi:hypothetical protein ACFVT5_14730 [Streptomyces sp. NPDC058001]|uniref:hypothetical protein n=1 Tax=Streptomyces sp. NPDC058001 TaxID=3346300 RepID=UPI0036E131B9
MIAERSLDAFFADLLDGINAVARYAECCLVDCFHRAGFRLCLAVVAVAGQRPADHDDGTKCRPAARSWQQLAVT